MPSRFFTVWVLGYDSFGGLHPERWVRLDLSGSDHEGGIAMASELFKQQFIDRDTPKWARKVALHLAFGRES